MDLLDYALYNKLKIKILKAWNFNNVKQIKR